jgi:iron complex outermembrane receptor protein
MNPTTSKMATLLGTASFFALATSLDANAQEQVAQAQMAQANPQTEIPEQVLITGSLIRGTAAVGVPVTNLGKADFIQAGAVSAADLFRTIPAFNVNVGGGIGTVAAGRGEGGTRVNLRQLDTGTAPRNLMMIDGLRFPPQDQGLCQIEPDIIPVVAIDRVDLLLDGASATYGSDAIGGVFNIILKRAYDGAVTEFGYKNGAGGNNEFYASQLWGRTWDGGDITLSYEWRNKQATKGNFNSRYTFDHSPWGLDNRNPLGSSTPGTISIGASAAPDQTNYPSANGRNCTNCYAIPTGTGTPFNGGLTGIGPTTPGSAPTLSWATLSAPANSGVINGTRNEFNPYLVADYGGALQFSGAAMTVDQRLTKDISFYGEGLYGMRRAQIFNQANGNALPSVAVPTWNPYYPSGTLCTTNPSTTVPAGVPAGCTPNNLRVAYHMGIESPSYSAGNELSLRYQGGLNISLPGDWAAQAYYSMTRDQNWINTTGTVNKNAVSAALGWTLPASAAGGSKPAIATWTKPANVPYLNLFCDPRAVACNSQTTLGYVGNVSRSDEAFLLNEKGIKADGPLFDLPGGTVKAAIGGNYTSNHYQISSINQNANNPTVDILNDPQSRSVWAVFAQVNVPVFTDMNALPFLKRLEFEGSWRHDQYSDFGGTSNPKIGFNWGPFDDLTIRGGWGTSFRAPNFGENSLISNAAWNGWGLPAALFTNNSTIQVTCDASGNAPAGSGSAKLKAAGFACGSQPGGMSFNGGAKGPVISDFREFTNQGSAVLQPEGSTNWSIGFDYSPTNFLRGLDIQATWYSIKINSVLVGFGNPTSSRFADTSLGFVYLVPSDVGCPQAQDSTPWLCANFQDMVAKALALPNNGITPVVQTLIYWLNDGGTQNKGWQRNTGIDYQFSYDWDMGDLGAWNAGIAGTYYLHVDTVRIPGAAGPAGEVVDGYHDTVTSVGGIAQEGVVTPRPRARARGRLGWSDGAWNVTGFVNYDGHFFHTQTAPPNVNFQCLTAGGTIGGGTNPCLINNYTNIEPSYYTFDLSLGYDTGDEPANDYLKHVGIQLTIDNVLDKHPAYEYRISTGGGNPSAFDILKALYGRVIGVRVTKTW